jgi:hypothetical protein
MAGDGVAPSCRRMGLALVAPLSTIAQTASSEAANVTAAKEGAPSIGVHLDIRIDTTLQPGRPLPAIPAQANDANHGKDPMVFEGDGNGQ